MGKFVDEVPEIIVVKQKSPKSRRVLPPIKDKIKKTKAPTTPKKINKSLILNLEKSLFSAMTGRSTTGLKKFQLKNGIRKYWSENQNGK